VLRERGPCPEKRDVRTGPKFEMPVRPATAGVVEINWSQLVQSRVGTKGLFMAAGAVFVAALGAAPACDRHSSTASFALALACMRPTRGGRSADDSFMQSCPPFDSCVLWAPRTASICSECDRGWQRCRRWWHTSRGMCVRAREANRVPATPCRLVRGRAYLLCGTCQPWLVRCAIASAERACVCAANLADAIGWRGGSEAAQRRQRRLVLTSKSCSSLSIKKPRPAARNRCGCRCLLCK
jgi:hypothetical protein